MKGKLQLSAIKDNKTRDKLHRNQKTQSEYGGPDPNYDGGHLIATLFQGPAEKINLVPQLKNQNRHGEWRKMEDKWAKHLKNNEDVYVEIRIVYSEDDTTPKRFSVKYNIAGQVQRIRKFLN